MRQRAWRQVNSPGIDQRRTDALPKSDGPHDRLTPTTRLGRCSVVGKPYALVVTYG